MKKEMSEVLEVEAPKIKARDKVMHKIFGEGTIRKKTGESLIIAFKDGDKFFQYPDAFIGGYLEKIKK